VPLPAEPPLEHHDWQSVSFAGGGGGMTRWYVTPVEPEVVIAAYGSALTGYESPEPGEFLLRTSDDGGTSIHSIEVAGPDGMRVKPPTATRGVALPHGTRTVVMEHSGWAPHRTP
jgi:hypothetical protein